MRLIHTLQIHVKEPRPCGRGKRPERHKKGADKSAPFSIRRSEGHSSIKSIFTSRWNTSCNEMFVSVVAMP